MSLRWRAALGAALAAVTLVGMGMGTAAAAPSVATATDTASVTAVTSQLLAGQTLASGQQLVSPNGSYRFVMQADGNLVLYGPTGALWNTRTFVPGTVLKMQGDGNLVAYAPGGRAVWASGTVGSGANRVVVQDDGNVVLYRPDNVAVWATNTAVPATTDTLAAGQRLLAGRSLVSKSGAYRLVMQGDGNLVIYGPLGATWATFTFVPGTLLVMQGDGNAVAYAPGGHPVWFTGTVGSGANRLVMQSDGNLVLYRPDGVPVWASGTVRAVPLALRGKDVTVIPTTQKVVALTFDAGANAAGLPSILATLAAKHVPATFFLTGQWTLANPTGVAQIRAGGYRIGNHSMTHPDFTTLSDTAMREQVLDAERTIIAAGANPWPWFRFPFGATNAHAIAVVNSVGYVAVRWTVDTLGWEGTSGGITVQTVIDRALAALQPGEIVLMHLGSNPDDGTTLDAAALPTMIDRMRAAGYGFVTMDALHG